MGRPCLRERSSTSTRQVALQVNAESEEVGQHQHAIRAGGGELRDRIVKAGRSFQKSRLEQIPRALAGGFICNGPDGVVRRRDARSVPEYDDAGAHELYRMIRGSSSGSTSVCAPSCKGR